MRKKHFILAAFTALVMLVSASIPALAQSEAADTTSPDQVTGPTLAMSGPGVAPVGKEVTITVTDRQTGEPVQGAGVWLVTHGRPGPAARAASPIEGSDVPIASQAVNCLIGVHGELIELSDENGQVQWTPEQPGVHLLVAVKDGYQPAFGAIAVRNAVSALGIRAPKTTPPGEPVTITVFDRQTQDPVPGAKVWALTQAHAETLKPQLAERRDGDADAEETDYEAMLSVYRPPIGETDENGQVTHTFEVEGIYLLVAVKQGHLPGFASIHARKPLNILRIRAPRVAQIGSPVVITVIDRQTQDPVPGARVWLISRDNTGELTSEVARLREAGEPVAEQDYDALVSLFGEPIGETGENGQITHTFEAEGLYLLVAVKQGHLPGFHFISVRSQAPDDSFESSGPGKELRQGLTLESGKGLRPRQAARPALLRARNARTVIDADTLH